MRPRIELSPPMVVVTTPSSLDVDKDMRQCETICPTHGVQCKLRMYEQSAFPMHAHATADGKTCIWKK